LQPKVHQNSIAAAAVAVAIAVAKAKAPSHPLGVKAGK